VPRVREPSHRGAISASARRSAVCRHAMHRLRASVDRCPSCDGGVGLGPLSPAREDPCRQSQRSMLPRHRPRVIHGCVRNVGVSPSAHARSTSAAGSCTQACAVSSVRTSGPMSVTSRRRSAGAPTRCASTCPGAAPNQRHQPALHTAVTSVAYDSPAGRERARMEMQITGLDGTAVNRIRSRRGRVRLIRARSAHDDQSRTYSTVPPRCRRWRRRRTLF
jgi:hypothetical protein